MKDEAWKQSKWSPTQKHVLDADAWPLLGERRRPHAAPPKVGKTIAEVVKKTRAILNKLTPEKFETLIGQVQELQIDSTEKLSAVIDLVFEKAVNEQCFSSTYARMCQVLSKMSVRGDASQFSNLIVEKCLKEFHKDDLCEFLARMERDLSKCTDPAQKQELKLELESQELQLRKRSVGNIKFLGELYKLNLLSVQTLTYVIDRLLQKGDEESLECLCTLLTTVGVLLSARCREDPALMKQLNGCFASLSAIARDRPCSRRLRFLIMDVIDLRRNRWVPRRKVAQPAKIAEVREEAQKEEERKSAFGRRGRRRN